MSSKIYIGCCGAYCKTCKVLADGYCKGCKLGYDTGERDLKRAKCKIKVCCINMKHDTCADCKGFTKCKTIHGFYDKGAYKYKKYKQSMEFISKNGYSEFFKHADKWNGPYGKIT